MYITIMLFITGTVFTIQNSTPGKKSSLQGFNSKINNFCYKHKVADFYCRCRKIKPIKFSGILSDIKAHRKSRTGNLDSMEKRLRTQGWFPEISMEWARYDDIDRTLNTSNEYITWDSNVYKRQYWKIKAIWKPGNLIFDSREINLLNVKRREISHLDSLFELGRRTFYDWKYQLIHFWKYPSLIKLIYLEESEELLNVLTGNSFSKMLRCHERRIIRKPKTEQAISSKNGSGSKMQRLKSSDQSNHK